MNFDRANVSPQFLSSDMQFDQLLICDAFSEADSSLQVPSEFIVTRNSFPVLLTAFGIDYFQDSLLPHSLLSIPIENFLPYDQPNHDIAHGSGPPIDGGTSFVMLRMPTPVIPVHIPTSDSDFFQDAVTNTGSLSVLSSILVPQRRYTHPNSHNHLGTYLSMAPICFNMEDGGKFRIEDAINGNHNGLIGRDDAIEFRSSSISIRIEWPGYISWKYQIKTRDFRNPPQPITRAKLGKEIGKCFDRFVDKMQSTNIDDFFQSWRVGRIGSPFVTVKDLAIVGIEQVSTSSWQPIVYRLS